jgi:hypothetical protein
MAFTQSDLTAIDRAIASGELSVSNDGSTVTYRSVAELRAARDLVVAELDSRAASARAYPRHQLADFSDD